jgi:hypothetical protein
MPLAGELGIQPEVEVTGDGHDVVPPPRTVRGVLYRCGIPLWPKSWTLGGWHERLC